MRARNGFTLVELLVVVVVIGILAAMAVPKFLDYARGAREAEAGPLLKQIYTLAEGQGARDGTYVTDIAELEGADRLADEGGYFVYSLTEHATGYCAVATPSEEGARAELDPQSLDARGIFHRSGDCSD